ncbi:hypothetical protein GF339_18510 [candidate division KSB3 bacterium]|jgi:hypothetical protein|uniref:DNA-binding protein n=1 Tax=candidate division KSB3 bacterium TaxID=2044937 RepID=A0A9D5JYQ9_9BACT|nr:hypothetical protein [candidate division KSB3 bacterium]MBD3326583.1 hypothetical protein [candidate division KSB3 bacterium]
MEKPTVYLETTIPSYYTARVSQHLIVAAHQAITQDWWQQEARKYECYISQFVLDEAAEGDQDAAKKRLDFLAPFPLLKITEEVLTLTELVLQTKYIPEKAIRDASHIAIAVVHNIDYLLTWNCTHINNALFKEKLRVLFEQQGFRLPIICTPEELMEETE